MVAYKRKEQAKPQRQYKRKYKLIFLILYIYMKPSEMLNQVQTLLGVEVKLEQMKLENGTVLEADKLS